MIKTRTIFIGLALVVGLAAMAAALWSVQVGETHAEGTETATLSVTVDGDGSVDLTLSNGPNPWWFRINGGRCVQVNGSTVSNIQGYKTGQHTVRAYSDSSCDVLLDGTTFTIPEPPSLSATVNENDSVDLTLTGGPRPWWFRIDGGTCTQVVGNTVSNIQGYQAGQHSVHAYSDGNCYYKITSATFAISEPLRTYTLTAVVADDGLTLTLQATPAHEGDWYRKIQGSSCTVASGPTDGPYSLLPYEPGKKYRVTAYSSPGCNGSDAVATTSFTVPVPPPTLTATVDDAWRLTATLSNGPNNWWITMNGAGCTPVTGPYHTARFLKSGTRSLEAHSDSDCSTQIASTTFTIPEANLAATVNNDLTVDFTLSVGPSGWWYQVDGSGSCTRVSGETTSGLSGYDAGTHTVKAYSDLNCRRDIASASFFIPYQLDTTVVNGGIYLRLDWANKDSWWYKVDSGSCSEATLRTWGPIAITNPSAESHTATAYNDSGCATQIASTTFAIPSMSATVSTSSIVDLTLSDWSGSWWYKVGSSGSCTSAGGTTVSGLSGYAAGTHTATAYSDSACTYWITSATFAIVAPRLSATVDNDWQVTVTLSNGPNQWWRTDNGAGCSPVTGSSFTYKEHESGTQSVEAWSDSSCSTQIATTTYTLADASLTATVDSDKSVDLALSNGPNSWWYKAGASGSCTSATGTTVNDLSGYDAGTHTATAYMDSNCRHDIATTTFTIVTPSLSATVDNDWQVTVTLSNGPNQWWRTDNGAGCSPVTGSSFTYKEHESGTQSVEAWSDSSCSTQIATTTYTLADASLTATVDSDKSVDLALSNGPNSWWYKAGASGSCTSATGTTVNDLSGYDAGTHTATAYMDSNCRHDIASTTFTIPDPSLSATVDNDWQTTVTLSYGPNQWWLTVNGVGCAAITGQSHSGQVYESGTRTVAAHSDSACSTQIASTTFTIADASLAATVDTDKTVDLALSDGPSSWWYKVGSSGSCTSATGTTVSGLSGYDAGTYTATAYSDSACTYRITSATFTMPDPSLSATVDNNWQVTVTMSYGPNQWWRTDNGAGCSPVTGSSFTYKEHESGTQSVEAWSDSSCSTQIATTTYTLADASLTATVDSDKSVDLALSNGPNSWWYKAGASGSCTSATGTTVDDLSGYDAGTHTVTAYMDSNCRHDIASTTFTIP